MCLCNVYTLRSPPVNEELEEKVVEENKEKGKVSKEGSLENEIITYVLNNYLEEKKMKIKDNWTDDWI